MASSVSLNEEQKQAVYHGEGPLLIIAGAGTGKTSVVTERIKYLIVEKKVNPSDILALTFTEKAAREMETRVDIALPYGYTQMWIATFHAFCDHILREDGIHIGLNPDYQLTTEAEAIMFLRKHLFKFNLQYFRPLGNPYKFLGGLLTHFSRLKDDDITPENYLAYAEKLSKTHDVDLQEIKKTRELAHAYQVYEDLKLKEGMMDFSDLNANLLKLFRTRSNVLSYYQEKFKYIMVDEFQDTNFAQNELAIMLAGNKKNITVVGDDDQAIYRWRGAALANIIQFRTHFPEAKIVTLNKNYRSTSEILTKSHQMIQHNNPDRLEIKEKVNKQLLSMREIKGDPIEFIFGNRVEQEAELVVQKIMELKKKKKFDYRDFAILVRANDHAQPFVRMLESARIPYQFLGPGHLFHQEEVKDFIAYLRVLYNFEDSGALYRVITNPIFHLHARDIASLLNFTKKKNISLFEALEQVADTFLTDEAKEKLTNISEMITKHLSLVPRNTAGQILYYFFDESGLLKKILAPETPYAEKTAQNIAKFFEKLKSYEANHDDASVFAVVDWIDLSMQLGESPLAADVDWIENNAVNILTVHSSKGLEFPVVFIVNLVSQRFPTRTRREQIPIPNDLIREEVPEGDQNVAEERRLFYVAMTRARDNLFLTAANYYGEGKRERKLSPFIYETLGEAEVVKTISKKKLEQNVTQLSLLDVLPKPTTDLDVEIPPSPSLALQYVSYSQIQTYEMCPLHYKLRYLLKLPSQPVAPLSFGTSVHAVLRDYYSHLTPQGTKKPEPVDMLLKRHWIAEGYESKSHMETAYKQAEFILNSYIKKHSPSVHATEMPFSFSLGPLKVGGRIDRVDLLPDGRIEIIDYKTGINVPSEKDLYKNLQLSFYALAATEVHDSIFGKKPEEVILSLHYLEADTILTTTRSKEQLEDAKEIIRQKVTDISQSDFVCSVINCKNCEYKMVCQTYAG